MKNYIQVKNIALLGLFFFVSVVPATANTKTAPKATSIKKYKLNIENKNKKKIGGLLLKRTLSKRATVDKIKENPVLFQKISSKINKESVAVYLTKKPTKIFDQKLKAFGILRKNNVWIPAEGEHDYGFAMYSVPISKIEFLANMPEIMRIESLEQTYNGQISKAIANSGINALAVWDRFDYYGQGLTIGIIDTGYDVGNPDLPNPIASWAYPGGILDKNADVTDTVSGHGTYIAGCIVGNGSLAKANNLVDMNGVAPSSQVHIVKADTTYYDIKIFQSEVLVQALYDLAESNCVDIINMSLGGWDAYHDGSSPLDQAVDYVSISKGIPVFCASGNLADQKRHVFLELGGFEGKTITFKLSTTNWQFHSVAFNLIWADDYDEDNHQLFYDRWDEFPQGDRSKYPLWPFDGKEYFAGVKIDSEHTYSNYFLGNSFDYTVSQRGKVKQKWYGLNEAMKWIQDENPHTHKTKTVRLFLTNKVNEVRDFHLYIDMNRNIGDYSYAKRPVFLNPEPETKYTITSPGTADRAFTVGAFVSRTDFSNCSTSSDKTTESTAPFASVSTFSGCGPRVDQINLKGKSEFFYEEVQYEYVKPDFICPGELVISVFDRNVRNNHTTPPLYSGTIWRQSQPSPSDYYINRQQDYTSLNYCCPLEIQGSISAFMWWDDLQNSYTSKYAMLGTSPASALAAGSAALILQAFPSLQVEELRRYMRPCEQTEFFPHNPGNYSISRGFGNLHLGDIFLNNYYVDTETYLNYLSLIPNSKTNLIIENDDTILVTNNLISLAGNYQAVYNQADFYLTNFLTGWSKAVDSVDLTNRIWWCDNVVLSNYIKQKIGLSLILEKPNESTEILDRNIWIQHKHGKQPPVITITSPTNAPQSIDDLPIYSFILAGVWADDSDDKTTNAIKSIKWYNNITRKSGTISNITVAGNGGTGTWSAGSISVENPSYNVITVTAVDDDGEASSDSIILSIGSMKLINIEKINFKVNLANPAKDLLKIQGVVKGVATDAEFKPEMDFYIDLIQTNGVTNLVTFSTTEKIKAKGRKAIYLGKDADGKIVKVIASRKKSSTDINLKIIMKKFDGLENIFEIEPVDAKKKDTIYNKEITIRGKVCGFIFNSSIVNVQYWGKINKNIIGKY